MSPPIAVLPPGWERAPSALPSPRDFLGQLLAALVVRHAEDEALGALEERVRAVHLFAPVLVRERHVARHVEHERVVGALAAEDVELAVEHLPRIGIAAPVDAVHDAVGAVAA